MKRQFEFRRRRSIDAFHVYSRSEADEIPAEAMRAGEWNLMQPFGDYECVCAHEKTNGPVKSNSAMPDEQRSMLHWLPLPFRGRLPDGESSSSEVSV